LSSELFVLVVFGFAEQDLFVAEFDDVCVVCLDVDCVYVGAVLYVEFGCGLTLDVEHVWVALFSLFFFAKVRG